MVEEKRKHNRGTRDKKVDDGGFSEVQKKFMKKIVVEWFEGMSSATLTSFMSLRNMQV